VASSRRLEVVIAGDAKGAKDAMDDVEGGASRLGSRLGSALGGAAKVIGVAAVGAVVGVGIALKGSYDAAVEAEKVSRETERVIQTTGGAANVTAGDVANLAKSISGMTGTSREAVAGVENLLLTFTNVKNVAGEGNDVFNRATGLALDMATVLGTDASGAAVQLGKALNDPIKGITALSRAGVSFTAEQKDQIKTLVEHGNSLEAQKLILGELQKEFGGAAAAAATPMEKLQNTIHNFQVELGEKLIPIVNAVVGWIGERLPAVFDVLGGVLQTAVQGVQGFVSVWNNVGDGATELSGFSGAMESAAITLRHFYDEVAAFVSTSVLPALSSAIDTLRNAAMTAWGWVPIVSGWLDNHKEILVGVAGVIGGALIIAIGAYTVSMASAAVATIAATWPILAILAAAGALAAGVAYLWNNWDTFRNVIQAVVTWLVANVPPIFETVRAVIQNFIETVLMPMIGYIQQNSEQLANIGKVLLAVVGIIVGVVVVAFAALVIGSIALTAAAAAVVIGFVALIAVLYNVVQVVWDVFNNVRDALGGVIDWFENVIQIGWDLAQNIGSAIADVIRWFYNLIQVAWDLAQNIGSAIADAIRWLNSVGVAAGDMAAAVGGKVGEVIGWFLGLPGRIQGAIGDLGGLLVNAGRSILEGLVRGFEGALGWAKDRIGGGLSSIRNLFPFSPAKEGPFSGRGWTTYSGQAIAEGLAAGMMARGGLVSSAADQLMQSAHIGVPTFGAGSPGSGGLPGVGGLAASTGGSSAPGGGLTVIFNGVAATKADVGRALDEALREYQRSGGTLVTTG
jgi:hypothetical protein